jgi:FtsP/CotA-like multicopper oxidase with cupredoxin domain
MKEEEMSKESKFLEVVITVTIFFVGIIGQAGASTLVPQTWLPGECIPQFQVKLPVFGPGYNADLPRIDALSHPALTIKMKEASRQVLPDPAKVSYPSQDGSGNNCPAVNFQNTTVWAYETSDWFTGQILGPAFWPAVTVENRRFESTMVEYVNELPGFAGGGLIQGLITIDQSIHWADPLGTTMQNSCLDGPPLATPCTQPFVGLPPATVHLHGGEVPSAFDGGPNSWFTSTGKKGPGFNTLFDAGTGKAVYLYPNSQEPGTLWFHDHALGSTRTNVYSGLAAFYFLRDPDNEPANLPSGPYEIEMALQDRQFDTNSQLYFPDGSDLKCGSGLPGDPCLNGPPTNPSVHPFWIPEFIGDVAVVNGSPWPFFNVEPRRYRFRILDGSNARMYRLSADRRLPAFQIGADDAYLDKPVPLTTKLFIAPGERADIIVDFSGLAGQTVTVTNDAAVPFPDGLFPVPHPVTNPDGTTTMAPADQPRMASIMQFRVVSPLVGADTSCNPANGECRRPVPTARLSNGQGLVAAGVEIDKVRQLVLKEFEGEGGPLEVLVNNTKWDGLRSPTISADFPADGISELPGVGSVELWEIINLTEDAHPMHTHLAQFQILNRQGYDEAAYAGEAEEDVTGAWAAAFPVNTLFNPQCTGGVFCPGYGPPNDYNTPNADGAIGGNPAISPYLLGTPTPPGPGESGWKDTAKAFPGQVMRILVRWTPTSMPVIPDTSLTGINLYPFDPTEGPGYVWHCHIIDHEDNEMMRPYRVTK